MTLGLLGVVPGIMLKGEGKGEVKEDMALSFPIARFMKIALIRLAVRGRGWSVAVRVDLLHTEFEVSAKHK